MYSRGNLGKYPPLVSVANQFSAVQDLANVSKLLNIRIANRLPRSLTIGVYRRLIDPRNELGVKLHPRLLWSIVF